MLRTVNRLVSTAKPRTATSMKDYRLLKRIERPELPQAGAARGERFNDGESAARKLSQLSQETDGLLTRLVRLRQNLVEIRQAMDGAKAQSALAETNEQLVLAALHAESVAETAVSELGELARLGQRDPLTNLPNRC